MRPVSVLHYRLRQSRTWRRAVWAALPLAALAAAAGIGDVRPPNAATMVSWIDALSARSGLVLNEVVVEGRRRTDAARLREALGVETGDPILTLDLELARDRIEALGWVASARVTRRPPDTLEITLVEREALALWQHRGALQLVDRDGVVFGSRDIEQFLDLPIVVGPGAPERAPALFSMLKTEPELLRRVRAATWISGRRWDVHVGRDVVVKLPERSPGSAWRILAGLEREHRILSRPITAIDMRLSERIAVQFQPDVLKRKDRDPGGRDA